MNLGSILQKFGRGLLETESAIKSGFLKTAVAQPLLGFMNIQRKLNPGSWLAEKTLPENLRPSTGQARLTSAINKGVESIRLQPKVIPPKLSQYEQKAGEMAGYAAPYGGTEALAGKVLEGSNLARIAPRLTSTIGRTTGWAGAGQLLTKPGEDRVKRLKEDLLTSTAYAVGGKVLRPILGALKGRIPLIGKYLESTPLKTGVKEELSGMWKGAKELPSVAKGYMKGELGELPQPGLGIKVVKGEDLLRQGIKFKGATNDEVLTEMKSSLPEGQFKAYTDFIKGGLKPGNPNQARLALDAEASVLYDKGWLLDKKTNMWAKPEMPTESIAGQAQPTQPGEAGLPQQVSTTPQPGQVTLTQTTSPTALKPQDELMSIFNEYKPLRAAQEAKYSLERGSKFGKVGEIYKQGEGMAGFQKAKTVLGGELEKVPVPPQVQSRIENFVKGGQADKMFNQIQQTKYMSEGEKTTAQSGLLKAFGGEIPTEGELKHLDTVFGSEFVDSLQQAEPWNWGVMNIASEVGGSMKVLMSSLGDMSAVLNQGVFYTTRHPIKALKLVGESGHGALSTKFYDTVNNEIKSHDYYPILKKYAPSLLRDVAEGSKSLAKSDEQFMVRALQKIPGLGHVIKATNRAFNTFINKAASDQFYGMTDALIKAGHDPAKNPEGFKAAASFVGDMTGRSNLGKMLNDATEFTNLLIYSPRLQVSNLRMLFSPALYSKAPAPVRNEVIKTYLSYAGVIGGILAVAKLKGADVKTDSRSSDFLKIKIGNRRWSPAGRLQPYMRAFTQILLGERKLASGEIQKQERWDLALSFLATKESPLIGLGKDVSAGFSGKKMAFTGEKATPWNITKQHFLSMLAQDVIDASKEVPWTQALLTTGVPAFLGVSTQSYKPNTKSSSSGTSITPPSFVGESSNTSSSGGGVNMGSIYNKYKR